MVDKDIEEVLTDKIRMKTLLNDDNFKWYMERLKVRRKSLIQQLGIGLSLKEQDMRLLQMEIKVLDGMLLSPFIVIQQAEFYETENEEEETE